MKELGLAPRDRFPDQSEWEKNLAKGFRDLTGHPPRDELQDCRGIPDPEHRIACTSYTKGEISNFISAIGCYYTEYDFQSIHLFRPIPGYETFPNYRGRMTQIRWSLGLRSTVADWLR
jgi:hypothetical protein